MDDGKVTFGTAAISDSAEILGLSSLYIAKRGEC